MFCQNCGKEVKTIYGIGGNSNQYWCDFCLKEMQPGFGVAFALLGSSLVVFYVFYEVVAFLIRP